MFKLNREKYCVYSKTKMLLFFCTIWCFICCLNSIYVLPAEMKIAVPLFESVSSNLFLSISAFSLFFINSILGIHALLLLRYVYLIKLWLLTQMIQWLLLSCILFNTSLLNMPFGFSMLFASTAYFSFREMCEKGT